MKSLFVCLTLGVSSFAYAGSLKKEVVYTGEGKQNVTCVQGEMERESDLSSIRSLTITRLISKAGRSTSIVYEFSNSKKIKKTYEFPGKGVVDTIVETGGVFQVCDRFSMD